MSWRNQWNSRGVSAALVAGQRTSVRLINGVQTHKWWCTARATVTNSNVSAADYVRNRGSILGALQVAINENGRDRNGLVEARNLRFMTECFAPSALLDTVRAAVTKNTAFSCRERFAIYAAAPIAVAPRETAYLENDPRQIFSIDFVLKNAPDMFILFTNAGSVTTVTNFTVELEQDYVKVENTLPYFIPTYRELVQPVTQANALDIFWLRSSAARIRALVMLQESVEGEVSDIITSMAIRGDQDDIIGPSQMTWANFVAQQQLEFGGNVIADPTVTGAAATTTAGFAYAMMYFQRFGRLNSVLDPSRYNNLRLELTDLPSVTGTIHTNSQIRIMLCELERPVATTGGRTLVTPTLPDFLK